MSAIARVTQRFPDDTEVTVELEVETSYPDAVSELVGRTLDLWRGAVASGEDEG